MIHVAHPIPHLKSSLSFDPRQIEDVDGQYFIMKNGDRKKTGETEENLKLLLYWYNKQDDSL